MPGPSAAPPWVWAILGGLALFCTFVRITAEVVREPGDRNPIDTYRRWLVRVFTAIARLIERVCRDAARVMLRVLRTTGNVVYGDWPPTHVPEADPLAHLDAADIVWFAENGYEPARAYVGRWLAAETAHETATRWRTTPLRDEDVWRPRADLTKRAPISVDGIHYNYSGNRALYDWGSSETVTG